jgi:hypothetical protein
MSKDAGSFDCILSRFVSGHFKKTVYKFSAEGIPTLA